QVAEIQVSGEGRRVAPPQPVVQRERRARERYLEPLRQVRLENIAGADVLDDARDGVEIARAREIGADAGDVRDGIGWSGRDARCEMRDASVRIPHPGS